MVMILKQCVNHAINYRGVNFTIWGSQIQTRSVDPASRGTRKMGRAPANIVTGAAPGVKPTESDFNRNRSRLRSVRIQMLLTRLVPLINCNIGIGKERDREI